MGGQEQLENAETEPRVGSSRRSLIQGAAVAGAAVWAAPVIVDSLFSPAAAASAPGCYKFSYRWPHGNSSTSSCSAWAASSQCAPSISGASCAPTGNFNPAAPPTISFSGCSYNPGGNVANSTVNIGSSACKIVSIKWFNDPGSTCTGALNAITPASSSASGNITSSGGDALRVVFVVQCT